jgi:hypothetical protein
MTRWPNAHYPGGTMSTTESQSKDEEKKTEQVSIVVNNKPVLVTKHTTGAGIKSAAGVPTAFELFHIKGKQEIPIEDEEKVTAHEGDKFTASPSLDPS